MPMRQYQMHDWKTNVKYQQQLSIKISTTTFRVNPVLFPIRIRLNQPVLFPIRIRFILVIN